MAKGGSGAAGGGHRISIRLGGEPPDTARGALRQDQSLADLRETNRRRARLIRKLRRVYRLGPRATAELVIALAERSDALPLLEDLAHRFAERLDPDLLRALGGYEFPPSPVRLVAERGR
jgi:hypothetical protein